MGNEFRRRILGGYEADVAEAKSRHFWWRDKDAGVLRYAKRVIRRRERREEHQELRRGDEA